MKNDNLYPRPKRSTDKVYKPKNDRQVYLFKAITSLSTQKQTASFLRDIMTEVEIEEFAKRLEIAKLLYEGKLSYKKIAEKVGASTTTVSRVASWFFNGCGGYMHVLELIKSDGSTNKAKECFV